MHDDELDSWIEKIARPDVPVGHATRVLALTDRSESHPPRRWMSGRWSSVRWGAPVAASVALAGAVWMWRGPGLLEQPSLPPVRVATNAAIESLPLRTPAVDVVGGQDSGPNARTAGRPGRPSPRRTTSLNTGQRDLLATTATPSEPPAPTDIPLPPIDLQPIEIATLEQLPAIEMSEIVVDPIVIESLPEQEQ